jgi:hypothetical protein
MEEEGVEEVMGSVVVVIVAICRASGGHVWVGGIGS